MTPAVDHDDRRRIATDLATTMLVEAGAGTGKTRALVERIVALIESGVAIERLVAITFTERAAAELRDRLRQSIDRQLADGVRPADDPSRALLERARDGLDRAPLGTIHSQCRRLLAALAAEAGIDPELHPADEIDSADHASRSWREHLHATAADGADGRAIARALDLNLSPANLNRLARRLIADPWLAERCRDAPPTPPDPPAADLRLAAAAVLALDTSRAGDDCRLLPHVLAAQRLAASLPTDDGELEGWARHHEAAGAPKPGNVGRAGDWPDATPPKAVRATLTDLRRAIGAHVDTLRTAALIDLLPQMCRVALEADRHRRHAGTPSFNDLLLWTGRMLRDSPAARARARSRLDALLIDEFQDTDPWQAEIALLLAGDDGAGPAAGRLFLVGDPKQSIYRFRGADTASYGAVRTRVEEAGGAMPQLVVNHRCRPPIIDWVNRHVAALFAEEEDPTIQIPYHPLVAARERPLQGPGVVTMVGPVAKDTGQMWAREATAVAAACRAAHAQGWQVDDPLHGPRPLRLGDIAILLPTRTGLEAIEDELQRAGIPHRIEGASLVMRSEEVRDIINLLAAVADPTDPVATLAALRGPAHACTDAELAAHRAAGGVFDLRIPAQEQPPGPVTDALHRLAQHHADRLRLSLPHLVERIIADGGLIESGIARTGRRDAHRRARVVLRQAAAMAAERRAGLGELVHWLEERAVATAREHDGAALDGDEDAVRVLTIHAAKGLEFPVVVLAGLGHTPGEPRTPIAAWRDGPLIRVGPRERGRFEVGDVAGWLAREGRHDLAEAARLLYVAATRARDHLVVSLHRGSKGGPSLAARLADHGAGADPWEPPATAPLAGERGWAVPAATEGVAAELHPDRRPELVERARRRRRHTATGRRGPQRPTPSPDAPRAPAEAEEGSGLGVDGGRGRGATGLGRAVHACLQSLPWDAGAQRIAATARAQAAAERVAERADEIADLVVAALASAAAGRAASHPGSLREVPFGIPHGDALVEGFIDLVIPGPEGLEVVDWKTDRVTRTTVGERLAGYRHQAGLYSWALMRATGRPVARITYVFLRAGLELSPGDPATLAAQAAAELGAPDDPGVGGAGD